MTNTFPFLVDASLKSAIILAAGLLLCLAARRRSAALRHLIGSLALAGAVAVPVLAATLPAWNVELTRVAGAESAKPRPAVAVTQSRVFEGSAPATPDAATAPLNPEPSTSAAEKVSGAVWAAKTVPDTLDWKLWAVTFYLLGVAVLVVRMLIGTLAVRRLISSASAITDGPWIETLAQVRTGGTRLRGRLLECSDLPIPATCGVLHPVILLPAHSGGWPAEQRRLILLHEIFHIRRRDGLTQLTAQFACALYWFNPLVWLLDHQVSLDRERACDDAVLTADTATHPTDYAQTLLDIAKSLQRTLIPQGVIPMARTSQLEPRVRSVLNASQWRRGPTRPTAIAWLVLALGLFVPLSAIRAVGEADAEGGSVSATLVNGTRVEMVGVAATPSAGRWWRADGTLLEAPPCDEPIGEELTLPGKRYALAVGIDATTLNDPALDIRVQGSTNTTWWDATLQRQRVQALRTVACAIPEDRRTTDVTVAVADGPWQAVRVVFPSESLYGNRLDTIHQGQPFLFNLEPRDHDLHLYVTQGHLPSDRFNIKIALIDHAGKEISPSTGGRFGAQNLSQWTGVFNNISRQNVKGAALYYRPWQTMEFRNVSLRPGVKTDVQIIGPHGAPPGARASSPAQNPEGKRATGGIFGSGAFIHNINFEMGRVQLPERDRVEITKITGTRPSFEQSGRYLIHGRYVLTSRDEAVVAAFIAVPLGAGGGWGPIRPGETVTIHRGSGEFTLAKTIESSGGYPHLALYPAPFGSGRQFGDVYFGQPGTPYTPAGAKRDERVAALDAYPHKLEVGIGHTGFADGDNLVITEVRGTKPVLEKGGTYVITGHYTLDSQDEAKLAMFVTATKPGEGRTVTRPGQMTVVKRGSGEFALIKTLETSAGWPHVSFYPAGGGSSLAISISVSTHRRTQCCTRSRRASATKLGDHPTRASRRRT